MKCNLHERAKLTTFSNHRTANDNCGLETKITLHVVAEVCQCIVQFWEITRRVERISPCILSKVVDRNLPVEGESDIGGGVGGGDGEQSARCFPLSVLTAGVLGFGFGSSSSSSLITAFRALVLAVFGLACPELVFSFFFFFFSLDFSLSFSFFRYSAEKCPFFLQ